MCLVKGPFKWNVVHKRGISGVSEKRMVWMRAKGIRGKPVKKVRRMFITIIYSFAFRSTPIVN